MWYRLHGQKEIVDECTTKKINLKIKLITNLKCFCHCFPMVHFTEALVLKTEHMRFEQSIVLQTLSEIPQFRIETMDVIYTCKAFYSYRN